MVHHELNGTVRPQGGGRPCPLASPRVLSGARRHHGRGRGLSPGGPGWPGAALLSCGVLVLSGGCFALALSAAFDKPLVLALCAAGYWQSRLGGRDYLSQESFSGGFLGARGQADRAISKAQLRLLPGFHMPPIDVVVYHGSQARPGFEGGFPLRCFQRLSRPPLATRRCGWRHNRSTRGASIPVLSY